MSRLEAMCRILLSFKHCSWFSEKMQWLSERAKLWMERARVESRARVCHVFNPFPECASASG